MFRSTLLLIFYVSFLGFLSDIRPVSAITFNQYYDQHVCCLNDGGTIGCDQSDGRVICKNGSIANQCRCIVNGDPRFTGLPQNENSVAGLSAGNP